MKKDKITLGNSISKDMYLSEGFAFFLRYKNSNNLTEQTIRFYTYNGYGRFMEYLKKDIKCSDITEKLVTNYINYLLEKSELKEKSVENYIRAIRTILYFLMEKKIINPFTIKNIKTDESLKAIYTNEELALLLEKPNLKEATFATYRTWVIICYLMATGNRINTVLNLRIKDLDFEYREIHLLKTKIRRSYSIEMSESLQEVLLEYLDYRKGEGEDYLFCTESGGKLEYAGFRSSLTRYNRAKGINKTSAHLFRHTFATLYMRSPGADIYQLKLMLEHSSLEQTENYINLLPGARAKKQTGINPLENFKDTIVSKRTIKLRP